MMTLEVAAHLFAQIPPDLYVAAVDVLPKERVPACLLALLSRYRGTASTIGGSLEEFLAFYRKVTAATRGPLPEAFTGLPVERLMKLSKSGAESIDDYLLKVREIVEDVGGLNIAEIAMLILLAQGATEAEILSRFQKQRAKKPRNRKPSPCSAAAFVKAVRKESKKQKWNTAWSWLEVDKQFDGFEVIKVTEKNIQYKYDGKDCKPIAKSTFIRRWQVTEKK
ncbi:hypothetical protein [Propionivibrio sp.]|uniref:hypothetical protein n=1 Tax=Propionivibrio sp. TaxID=2212460 RepID=UPI0039E416DF